MATSMCGTVVLELYYANCASVVDDHFPMSQGMYRALARAVHAIVSWPSPPFRGLGHETMHATALMQLVLQYYIIISYSIHYNINGYMVLNSYIYIYINYI